MLVGGVFKQVKVPHFPAEMTVKHASVKFLKLKTGRTAFSGWNVGARQLNKRISFLE